MSSEVELSQSDEMRSQFKLAQFMSTSEIIPTVFKNKPANVFIAMQLAQRMNVPAMEIMQNLYIVHGNPTFKTSYLIARANESGIFSEPIQYEIQGEIGNETITAYAHLKCSGTRISAQVSMDMARKEGWTKNEKYKSMNVQMLCFRAAAFLLRRYAPQIALGISSKEEIEDTTERSESAREKMNRKIAEISKILPSDKQLAIEDNELQLGIKESQIDTTEVMESCQE